MKRMLYSACAGVALLTGSGCDSNISSVFGGGLGFGAPTCQAIADEGEFAQELLRLVNQAREEIGLFPLEMDTELARFAEDWACTMIEDGFFEHEHPDGEDFAERWFSTFDECYFGGENLARHVNTPAEVFKAWFESDLHRAEMFTDGYTHMGVSIRSDGQNLYWVQEFRGGDCGTELAPFPKPGIIITDLLAPSPPLPNERSTPTPLTTPQSDDR